MELSYLLFTGSLSGLISILGHSVVWSLIEVLRPRRPGTFDPQVQISEAFLHMALGIALGFLFWVSWGLAAVVAVQWWVRGLAFGGIAALCALLPLAHLFFARRLDGRLAALFGSRWLTTCIAGGLGCAWSWENSL